MPFLPFERIVDFLVVGVVLLFFTIVFFEFIFSGREIRWLGWLLNINESFVPAFSCSFGRLEAVFAGSLRRETGGQSWCWTWCSGTYHGSLRMVGCSDAVGCFEFWKTYLFVWLCFLFAWTDFFVSWQKCFAVLLTEFPFCRYWPSRPSFPPIVSVLPVEPTKTTCSSSNLYY